MPIETLCQRSSAFMSLDNGCWTMEEMGFPRSKKMCLRGTWENILGPLEPFVFREKIFASCRKKNWWEALTTCGWLANWSLGLLMKTWHFPGTLYLGSQGPTGINIFHMQFIYQLLHGTGYSLEVKKNSISIGCVRPDKMLVKASSILTLKDSGQVLIGYESSIRQELINRKICIL